MLLRAVRARLLPSLATLVLAFVVAAGAVAVVGASRVGGTPGAVAAMLALYGAVALADQTARAVADRSHDVALARLRGLHGAGLVLFAAGPMLAVTLVGTGSGAVAGTWIARRTAAGWSVGYQLGTREVLVGIAILAGAWVTVAVVSAAVIRRPLADALSAHPRRRSSPWFATFLELLVVVGACLAVYEAHRSERSWVPTIAPALVALAAGQVVMWLLLLTPRFGRRLGPTLTSRRLRRDPDPGSVVRILVAAAVLLAITLTGTRAAADWRDDAGRLRAGGPLVVPFTDGGLRAYAAAHDADPRGQWLMAAVSVNDLSPDARRVFVDSRRWNAVVGDFMGGTSAGGAGDRMASLGAAPGPTLLRGDTLTADVTEPPADGQEGVVSLRYLSDRGFLQVAKVHVDGPGTATGPLRACAVGCAPVQVRFSGDAFGVSGVSAGPTRVVGTTSYAGGRPLAVLTVRAGRTPVPALTTPGLKISSRLDGIDGNTRPVRVVGPVGGVPFVGRAGSLLDLGQVLRGAVGTVAGARSVVVARADTPPAVLARLRGLGGGRPTTYAASAASLDHTPQARADRLALLVALGVALVALSHLLAWLASQAGRRRTEVASLRTAGFRPRSVRRAYLFEASALAGVVLAATVVVAVATTVVLLEPMDLVGGWAQAPLPDLGVRPLTVGAAVLGVCAVTVGACALVFTRFGRAARPAALRSADQ